MNFWFAISRRNGSRRIEVGKTNNGKRQLLWHKSHPGAGVIDLKIHVDGQESATFYFRSNNQNWTKVGKSIYFGDSWKDLRNGKGGNPDLGWVGIKKRNAWSATTFAVFAVHAEGNSKNADFDWVRVEGKDEG